MFSFSITEKYFDFNGKRYYANKNNTLGETMIWECSKDGNRGDDECYVDQSNQSIEDCIEEFKNPDKYKDKVKENKYDEMFNKFTNQAIESVIKEKMKKQDEIVNEMKVRYQILCHKRNIVKERKMLIELMASNNYPIDQIIKESQQMSLEMDEIIEEVDKLEKKHSEVDNLNYDVEQLLDKC